MIGFYCPIKHFYRYLIETLFCSLILLLTSWALIDFIYRMCRFGCGVKVKNVYWTIESSWKNAWVFWIPWNISRYLLAIHALLLGILQNLSGFSCFGIIQYYSSAKAPSVNVPLACIFRGKSTSYKCSEGFMTSKKCEYWSILLLSTMLIFIACWESIVIVGSSDFMILKILNRVNFS